MTVNEKIYEVLRYPVVTEKSTALAEQGMYVFKVALDATKAYIKKAVELVFNVKVEKVNTLHVKGKKKVFRGRPGQRKDYKKAIIKLAKGQKIDLNVSN